jgi:hypothetical protein
MRKIAKGMRVPEMRHEAIALERDENGVLFASQFIPQQVAEHDDALTYRVEYPNGKVTVHPRTEDSTITIKVDGDTHEVPIKIPVAHPDGNRQHRRARQRHHPYYTKSRHKGREWWRSVNG